VADHATTVPFQTPLVPTASCLHATFIVYLAEGSQDREGWPLRRLSGLDVEGAVSSVIVGLGWPVKSAWEQNQVWEVGQLMTTKRLCGRRGGLEWGITYAMWFGVIKMDRSDGASEGDH
jgi:hypothetical protein